jgi:hypothetical protein
MSKETRHAVPCACGIVFAFQEYHWPHCPFNPENLSGTLKVGMESRFTKAELAGIANHGPVADKQIAKRRPGRGKRPSAGKAGRA